MPDLFARLSLLDFCDILILAVFLYYSALLLKYDVAIRLYLILLAFFTALLASLVSGLVATTHLLQTLFSSSIIILAIIFQADIRRVLLTTSRRRIEPIVHDEEIEMIEELIRASAEMAEKRIGALMVIVRQNPIDHLLEIGTQIEAKVTSELLNSIFLPYSPIHDGAVIINDGKITKAGCLLPLSRNPDISKSFGTRHRAALGLSELVDALVVVVSEETGKISLVHDGKINYDLDATTIRRMLKKALDVKRSAKTPASGDR